MLYGCNTKKSGNTEAGAVFPLESFSESDWPIFSSTFPIRLPNKSAISLLAAQRLASMHGLDALLRNRCIRWS